MLPFPIMNTYGNEIPKPKIKKVATLAAAFCTVVALNDNGDLYYIGYDTGAIMGTGGSNQKTTWYKIMSNVKNFYAHASDSIATNTYGVMLVQTNDNKFYYCGSNAFTGAATPARVNTFTECTSLFSTISTSLISDIKIYDNMYILLSTGQLYMTGFNANGYGAGTGSLAKVTAPVLVSTNVKSISCAFNSNGNDSTWYIKNDGTVWRFGFNGNGQLATGNATALTIATQYTSTPAGYTIQDIMPGWLTTHAVLKNTSTSAYTIYSCGWQLSGALGNSQTSNVNILSLTAITAGTAVPTDPYIIGSNNINGSAISPCIYFGSSTYRTGTGTSGQFGNGTTGTFGTYRASNTIPGSLKFLSASNTNNIVVLLDDSIYLAGSNHLGSTYTTYTKLPNII